MRWMRFAHLARYGHQPIATLLGRVPTEFETLLLDSCIDEWLEAETPELPDFVTKS